MRLWIRELRRRWPAIVGILRGRTVVYAAHIDLDRRVLVGNVRGCVAIDNTLKRTTLELSDESWRNWSPDDDPNFKLRTTGTFALDYVAGWVIRTR